MVEVQSHGFVFENWVKDTFFNGYRGGYSDKWDVPMKFNKKGLPVSIKTAKYGSTIGLGDAIRQFSTDEDFLLIVGFWKQEGKLKRIVNASSVIIKKDDWKDLWVPIKLIDLQKLDSLIKNMNIGHKEVRIMAQDLKKTTPYSLAKITLNPKIDSKKQRRLQCGIKFNLYFEKFATNTSSEIIENPSLFGVNVPPPWKSEGRKFNR